MITMFYIKSKTPGGTPAQAQYVEPLVIFIIDIHSVPYTGGICNPSLLTFR